MQLQPAELLLAAASRFCLDEEDIASDDRVCIYLTDCIGNDDGYSLFVRTLRDYRQYAGVTRRMVATFMYALSRFSVEPQCPVMRAWMAQTFRSTLLVMERMRATSLLRRDFAGDFLRDGHFRDEEE